jgi:RimJ/RimL family protein N-acetyltransferase
MTFPLVLPITTERLTLRGYGVADGELLYKVSRRNLEHWKRFESGNILYNIIDLQTARMITQQLVEEWQHQRNFFVAVFERTSGEYVGQVYVGQQKAGQVEFEVGYVADVVHEGRGYISEAVKAVVETLFNHTDAVRIVIHCSDANPRSAHVAERCGFRLVDRIRFENQPAGETSLVYVLNKDDWQKTQRVN